MAKRNYKDKSQVEAVLKEAMWLAWNAAGRPMGMGVFQDRPGASKEDVWENVKTRGDYPCCYERPGEANADYVFGRMMKLYVRYGDDFIEVPEHECRADYQAWCRKYKTYNDLFDAAEKSQKDG